MPNYWPQWYSPLGQVDFNLLIHVNKTPQEALSFGLLDAERMPPDIFGGR
jgi:hypothetical protein